MSGSIVVAANRGATGNGKRIIQADLMGRFPQKNAGTDYSAPAFSGLRDDARRC